MLAAYEVPDVTHEAIVTAHADREVIARDGQVTGAAEIDG